MPNLKEVVFLTEGGRKYGYGHLSRMQSMREALLSFGFSVSFFVRGDETVEAVLPPCSYLLCDWLVSPVLNQDAIVIDSYSYGCDFAGEISRKAKNIIFFDDNFRIPYPRGVVVNGAINAAALNYPASQDVRYLLGSRYQLIRKDFFAPHTVTPVRSHCEVLVTFGGGNSFGLLVRILRLFKSKFPHIRKTVVIPRGITNLAATPEVRDCATKILCGPSSDELASVMRSASFAVCAGGQTLFELAACGTPAVVIGIADNQRLNIAGFENSGFISFAGWHDSENLEDSIIQKVEYMQNDKVLSNMRDAGARLVNPNAAKELCQEIFGCVANQE